MDTKIDSQTWRGPDIAHGLSAAPPPPPSPVPVIELDDLYDNGKCLLAAHTALYVDGVSTNDVHQTGVADCTLHAVMASLARTPEGQRVLQSHIETTRDPWGTECYRVHVFAKTQAGDFVPKTVTVSPCQLRDRPPPGADRMEIWPKVLEHAILQANAPTVPGNVPDSFGMLTGHNTTRETSTASPSIERRLADGFRTKMVQTFSTGDHVPAELKLHPNHCYTVVDVLVQNGRTWVQLRNPWGSDDPSDRFIPMDQVRRCFERYSEAPLP